MAGSGRKNTVSLEHCVMSENKKFSKIDKGMSRGHKIIFEEIAIGQIWYNLSLKKNNDGNGFNTLRNEFMNHGNTHFQRIRKKMCEEKSLFYRKIPTNKCRRNDKIIRSSLCNQHFIN